MQESIRIPLSKTKIALRCVGSFAFVAAACWMWVNAGISSRFSPEIMKIIAVLAVLFFGPIALFGLAKLLNPDPGLLIDEKGIQDNSSAFGKYFIPWENVLRLKTERVKNTQFLLLFLKNPEDVLREVGRFQRFWMRQNLKLYGTPVSISSGALQCDFKTLSAIVQAGFELNRELH